MYNLLIDKNSKLEAIELEGDGGLILEQNNPLEFSFGKSFKTYTIKIPNTPRNNLLLDNLWYNNGTKQKEFDTILYIDGVQIEGYIKILKINDKEIECNFISFQGKLWNALKDKYLDEYFDWNELNHIRNLDNITDTTKKDYIYDAAVRGIDDNNNKLPIDVVINNRYNILSNYFYFYEGSSLSGYDWDPVFFNNYDSGSDVTYGSNNKLECQVGNDIVNRQPAINLKYLLQKIFDGYNIEQDIWSDEAFDNLYILNSQKNKKRNTDNFKDKAELNITGIDGGDEYTEANTNTQFWETGTSPYTYEVYTLSNEFLVKADKIPENNFLHQMNFSSSAISDWVDFKRKPTYGYEYISDEDTSIRLFLSLREGVNYNGYTPTIDKYKNSEMGIKVELYNEDNTYNRDIYKKINYNAFSLAGFFNTIDTGYFDIKAGQRVVIVFYSKFTYESDIDESANLDQLQVDFRHRQFFVNWDRAEQDNDDLNNLVDTIIKPGSKGAIVIRDDVGYNGEVDGSWIIPHIKVSDFLKNILQSYNINFYFSKNENKIILRNLNKFDNFTVYNISDIIEKGSLNFDKFFKKYNWNFNFNESNTLFNINILRGYTFNGQDELVYDVGEELNNEYTISIPYTYFLNPDYATGIDYNTLAITNSETFSVQKIENIIGDAPFEYEKIDVEYPKYTTNNDIQLMFYIGATDITKSDSLPSYQYIDPSVNGQSIYSGQLPKFSNVYDADNSLLIEDIFENNFKNIINSRNGQKLLKANLYIDRSFLSDIYNFNGRDLTAIYYIDIDGYKGYYRIIKLNKKQGQLYEATLMKIKDIAYGEYTPLGGEFNISFNDSFNNEGILDPSITYYKVGVKTDPIGVAEVSINNAESGYFEEGDIANINVDLINNPQYVFDRWEEGTSPFSSDMNSTYTVKDYDATLTAIFNYNPSLYTVTTQSNTAIITTTGDGTYEYGEVVTIEATVIDNGYEFIYWKDEDDNIVSYNKQYTFNMPQKNKIYTAVEQPAINPS